MSMVTKAIEVQVRRIVVEAVEQALDGLPLSTIEDDAIREIVNLLELARGRGRLQGKQHAYATVMGFGDTIRRVDVQELHDEVSQILEVLE